MKYVKILLIALIVMLIGCTQVKAFDSTDKGFKIANTDVRVEEGSTDSRGFSSSDISGLDLNAYNPGKVQNANSLLNVGNVIIGIIQFVGSIVAILVIIVVGIKYVTGSVEEKAEYKKTMLAYVIGAVLLFSISNVVKIISDIAGSLQNI